MIDCMCVSVCVSLCITVCVSACVSVRMLLLFSVCVDRTFHRPIACSDSLIPCTNSLIPCTESCSPANRRAPTSKNKVLIAPLISLFYNLVHLHDNISLRVILVIELGTTCHEMRMTQ